VQPLQTNFFLRFCRRAPGADFPQKPQQSLLSNTQHPGNGDPSATNFPAAQRSGKIPRDCTIVITRKDGGIIGS
jgi:secreted PhoX family phosphatase